MIKYPLRFLVVLLSVSFLHLAYADEVKPDIKNLTIRAEHWDTDAQYLLGELYAQGIGVKADAKKAAFWDFLSDMWVNPPNPKIYLSGPRKAEDAFRSVLMDKSYDIMKLTSVWRLQHISELKEALRKRYVGQTEKTLVTDYTTAPLSDWTVADHLTEQLNSPCKNNTHLLIRERSSRSMVFWCSDSSGKITWIDAELQR